MVGNSPPPDHMSPSDGGKRFKGVRMRSWGKWVSEIRLPNTRARLWLGSYATAEQAARAYDVALTCLRGPSASLNFPSSPPAYAPRGLPPHRIQELAAAAGAAISAGPSSPASISASIFEEEDGGDGLQELMEVDNQAVEQNADCALTQAMNELEQHNNSAERCLTQQLSEISVGSPSQLHAPPASTFYDVDSILFSNEELPGCSQWEVTVCDPIVPIDEDYTTFPESSLWSFCAHR